MTWWFATSGNGGPIIPTLGTQANPPSAGANDASLGSIAWTNPGGILVSDNARSIATLAAPSSDAVTNLLVATGFGFSAGDFPGNAHNFAVAVYIERSDLGGDEELGLYATDHELRLVKGGVVQSVNIAQDTAYHPLVDITNEFVFYGDHLAGWTVDDFATAGFGVAYAARIFTEADVGTNSARVDQIRVQVFCNGDPPGPPGPPGGP